MHLIEMQKPRRVSICRDIQQKAVDLLSFPQAYFESFDLIRVCRNIYHNWPFEPSKRSLDAADIPNEFREPHILTGYRPRATLKGCIGSLFWLHNESFNCWSHILGIPLVFHYIIDECLRPLPDTIMLLYLFTALCFVGGSSFAHTFCCHSTLSRHASFIVDYIGLTVFSHGSGIAYVSYAFPVELRAKTGLFGLSFLETYLISLCLCSSLSIFQSAWSRTLPPSLFRNIIRVSAFAAPGVLMSIPVLYKVIACSNGAQNYPFGYCDSSELWPNQFMSCITGIIVYVVHFPECLFPGNFDLLGHSHNVFHIAGLVGLYYQREALSLDMEFTKSNILASTPTKLPFICISILFLSIIFTCAFFRNIFTSKNSTAPQRDL